MFNTMNRSLRGMLVASVLVTPAYALNDDVAAQLLERLNALESEINTLRSENERLRDRTQGTPTREDELADFNRALEALDNPPPPPREPSTPPPALLPDIELVDEPPLAPVIVEPSRPAATEEATQATTPAIPVDLGTSDSYYYYGTGGDTRNADTTTEAPVAPPAVATPAPLPPPVPAVAETPSLVTPTVARELPPENVIRAEYNEAYKLLVNNPTSSVPAFRAFLLSYPRHELAGNAQYWLGEALYAQRDYEGAIAEFMKVLREYRDSPKADGAALKLGYSYYELRQWDFARRTLEDTIRFFPDSGSARLAQARLQRMREEGY